MLPLSIVMLFCLLSIGGALVVCKKKKKEEVVPKVEEKEEQPKSVKKPKPKCKVQPRDADGNQFGECAKHGKMGWDFVRGDCYLCETKTRDLGYLDREEAKLAARKQKKVDPEYFKLPPKEAD